MKFIRFGGTIINVETIMDLTISWLYRELPQLEIKTSTKKVYAFPLNSDKDLGAMMDSITDFINGKKEENVLDLIEYADEEVEEQCCYTLQTNVQWDVLIA